MTKEQDKAEEQARLAAAADKYKKKLNPRPSVAERRVVTLRGSSLLPGSADALPPPGQFVPFVPNEKVQCDICHESFTYRKQLMRHRYT